MSKPVTLEGYSEQVTRDCERVLVTLLRNLGPHRESLVLIGGLTPRYLVSARPPIVPQHAGTLDIDVVIDLVVLEDTDAYRTLEENLKKIGFERGENDKGQKVNWRWKVRMDDGATIVLELLADHPDLRGGRAQPIPDEGQISALNIPHSSIVFDLYDTAQVTAELLGSNGLATETIKHANIVSFTCLKAIAYNDRQERKDAHDLVYCLEHVPQTLTEVAAMFQNGLNGKHRDVLLHSLTLLQRRFATDANAEGYLKDGPVSVAKFELGEDDDTREARALRQREAAEVIESLLGGIEVPA
jgi:Nucleotidyl transferase AbiEii toxin, Type IV TA system